MPQYHGGCHCKAMTYVLTIEKPIEEVDAGTCNCSICNRRGSIMYYLPEDNVVFTGKDKLKLYTFGFKQWNHRFCSECGIHVIVEGADASVDNGFWVGKVGVNLRTLDDIDVAGLNVTKYNGREYPAEKDEVFQRI